MVQLFGRLTKDAIENKVKDGKKVLNFSLALNDSYKPKGGEVVKATTYINCSYWLNAENIAGYLTKGSLVEVYGRLGIDVWNNAEGEAKGAITMHVDRLKLHGGRKPSDAEPAEVSERRAAEQPANATAPVDDLPF